MSKSKRLTALAIVFAMLAGLLPELTLEARAAGVSLPLNSQTLTPGQTYELAAGSATGVSFTIPEGDAVTIYVNYETRIDNRNIGGSPIQITENASLHLIVNGTLTCYGQNGETGKPNKANTIQPDAKGGAAGIEVPENATLIVTGSGSLRAYGGDAGDGGKNTDCRNGGQNWGSGSGGGAGAGIGGSGGLGGNGGQGQLNQIINSQPAGDGMNCGKIVIGEEFGSLTACGGSGGSGGQGSITHEAGGSGAGGYPAAGIGGGGAGGSGAGDGVPGAGFSSGATEGSGTQAYIPGINGEMDPQDLYKVGSYFIGRGQPAADYDGGIGGMGMKNMPQLFGVVAPGGRAGSGGRVLIAMPLENTNIKNGSYITTSSSEEQGWGASPTPIYAQLGFSLNDMRAAGVTSVNGRTDDAIVAELSGKVPQNLHRTGVAGVGSGAGCFESSNGTYIQTFDISSNSLSITETDETYYVTEEGENHGA